MIGYAGQSEDPERFRRLARLAEPAARFVTHREDGVAIVLKRPPACRDERIHLAEFVGDECRLLAFEGYLLEADASRGGLQPAQWLLEQHALKGLSALQSLNGAYSFCLFDRRERRAWIGSCIYGSVDLYYMREGGGVIFATDLEPLLKLTERPPGLATDQLSSTFTCGAVYGGETLLQGVRRALPGGLVHVAPPNLIETPPGLLAQPPGDELGEDEALEELDRCFRTALARLSCVTQRRVVLMGAGVDSSLAAVYLKLVTGELEAITVGMLTPPDETDDARILTEALGGVHHASRFQMDGADILAEIGEFVRVMEEPIWFGLGLLLMPMARMGRTIADGFLSGIGADMFFGYSYCDPEDPMCAYDYFYRDLDPDCVRQVVRLSGPHPDEMVRQLYARLPGEPRLRNLHLDFLLQGALMIRLAARLARVHQAEALFPYLDPDVIDLSLRMPFRLHQENKPLLRRLAARHYGDNLLQTRKVPFGAYPIKWIRAAGRLGPLLDLLDEKRTRQRGIYREKGLQRLTDSYRTGHPDRKWNLVLWQLVVLELFCRRFVDLGSVKE